MAWKVEFTPEAFKILTSLERNTATRITQFMRERVATMEDPRNIGTPLKGAAFSGLWRYRVGDYRVLCEIQDSKITVLVVLIGHRCENYR